MLLTDPLESHPVSLPLLIIIMSFHTFLKFYTNLYGRKVVYNDGVTECFMLN